MNYWMNINKKKQRIKSSLNGNDKQTPEVIKFNTLHIWNICMSQFARATVLP